MRAGDGRRARAFRRTSKNSEGSRDNRYSIRRSRRLSSGASSAPGAEKQIPFAERTAGQHLDGVHGAGVVLDDGDEFLVAGASNRQFLHAQVGGAPANHHARAQVAVKLHALPQIVRKLNLHASSSNGLLSPCRLQPLDPPVNEAEDGLDLLGAAAKKDEFRPPPARQAYRPGRPAGETDNRLLRAGRHCQHAHAPTSPGHGPHSPRARSIKSWHGLHLPQPVAPAPARAHGFPKAARHARRPRGI